MKKLLLGITSALLLLASAGLSQAQSFVGLGTTGLSLQFYGPGSFTPTNVAVIGVNGGTTLIGIDYRPSDGLLYGMGSDGTLYTLSSTGVATINTSGAFGGTPTAIDHNPVANRLRVFVGTNNFRITPGAGTLTSDGPFVYASGDAHEGATPTLVAAAYTNSFNGAATTSLYSIDANFNTLVLHSNTAGGPTGNFSTLSTVGNLMLLGASFDAIAGVTGLDILGGASFAYFTNGNDLYTLDLTTAVLTSVGTFGGGSLIDIAVVPEPSTSALIGLGLIVGFIALRRRVATA